MNVRLTSIRRFARRVSLPLLLLYLLQGGAAVEGLITMTETDQDVCCDVCSEGGPCCCLAALGATSCDLTFYTGEALRPSPCGGLGTSAAAPTASAVIDHLVPDSNQLAMLPPHGRRPAWGDLKAHSIPPGSLEKIPIV